MYGIVMQRSSKQTGEHTVETAQSCPLDQSYRIDLDNYNPNSYHHLFNQRIACFHRLTAGIKVISFQHRV